MKKLIIAILLFASSAFAADLCVGPTASGDGNGGDWSNIAQWSTLTFTRGNTYYLQDGTYAAKTLSTAYNSDGTIYIKKATAAAHGSATGWSSTYGDGQAVIAGLTINTSYWEFDGVSRTESNWQADAYGIKVTADTGNLITLGANSTHITFKYLDIGGQVGRTYSDGIPTRLIQMTAGGIDNLTVQRCHIHNGEFAFYSRTNASATIEYCHIGPDFGKETITHQYGNGWIIRWNKFIDGCSLPANEGGTALIGVFDYDGNDPDDVDADNWEIYGNVFARTGTYSGGVNAALVVANYGHNWKFYNNTIIAGAGTHGGEISISGTGNSIKNTLIFTAGDYDANYASIMGSSDDTYTWCVANPIKRAGSSTSTASNKLIDSTASFTSYSLVAAAEPPQDVVVNVTDGTYAGVTAVDSGTQISLTSNIFTGTGKQYVIHKGAHPVGDGVPNDCREFTSPVLGYENPFTDSANGDYSLKESFTGPSPKIAGENLGAPYNTDMLGQTRRASGLWDLGAITYYTTSSPGYTYPGFKVGTGAAFKLGTGAGFKIE